MMGLRHYIVGLLMFELTNRREFISGLDKFEKGMDLAIEEIYRGWSVMIFGRILRTTPQWTGNAVANWAYNVGSAYTHNNDVILREHDYAEGTGLGPKPKKMGHPEAIRMARSASTGKEKKAKLKGSKLPVIFISNNAKSLSGKSYIRHLEDNPGNFLRAENEPGHIVARTIDFYGNKGDLSKDSRTYRGARI